MPFFSFFGIGGFYTWALGWCLFVFRLIRLFFGLNFFAFVGSSLLMILCSKLSWSIVG
jgi:hypothetical protein